MDLIDKIMGGLFFLFVSILIILLWLFVVDLAFWASCKASYEDSQYSFWGGCKVEYNWEYIPESLYEKAFEQNLIINK